MISIGALAHYCYCLANALANDGVEVVLYTDGNYNFDRYETKFTLKKIIGTTRTFGQWTRKLIDDIEGERPDIVHVQSYRKYLTLDLILGRSLKRTGAALAFTFHDLITFKRGLYSYATTAHHHFILKYLYLPLFDGFIAHSVTAKNEVQKKYGINGSLITVVPHGIMDCYDFGACTREQARRLLNLAERDFVLLYFGNIGRRKGLQDLLRAYTACRNAGQERIKLIIAGTGRDYYEKYLRPLSGEEVILYKNLERIPDRDIEILFKAADLVVLPYVESTTSGNLKIAVAFNKPVIATCVGEFPEYVGKYRVVIIPPHSCEALASAILNYMNDNSTIAIESDLTDHSWDQIAIKTSFFYGVINRSVVGGGLRRNIHGNSASL
jgi:glycosyltransferase involved in cell wall biosynthesis